MCVYIYVQYGIHVRYISVRSFLFLVFICYDITFADLPTFLESYDM